MWCTAHCTWLHSDPLRWPCCSSACRLRGPRHVRHSNTPLVCSVAPFNACAATARVTPHPLRSEEQATRCYACRRRAKGRAAGLQELSLELPDALRARGGRPVAGAAAAAVKVSSSRRATRLPPPPPLPPPLQAAAKASTSLPSAAPSLATAKAPVSLPSTAALAAAAALPWRNAAVRGTVLRLLRRTAELPPPPAAAGVAKAAAGAAARIERIASALL